SPSPDGRRGNPCTGAHSAKILRGSAFQTTVIRPSARGSQLQRSSEQRAEKGEGQRPADRDGMGRNRIAPAPLLAVRRITRGRLVVGDAEAGMARLGRPPGGQG